ncbi:MAG: hypothetical protein HEP71_03130 [Roseivirga sp.]|nr:hypothetical protein [Roseivirga sp.]
MRTNIISAFLVILSASYTQAQSDFTPAYSPNGKQIAFYRYVNKVPEIMIINTDGQHLYQLTKTTGIWSIGPIWSKDGNSIYFSHGEGMANLDASTIALKTGKVERMKKEGMQFSLGASKKGLIWANKGANGMTYYEASGKDLSHTRQITVDGFENFTYVNHPGKSLIIAVKTEGKEGIYVKKPGGEFKRVADHKKPQNVSVSPNSKYLLFESSVNQNSDIYMVKTDGTELKRLTTDEAPDYMPAFSPNGKSIVFSSARSGAFYLYTMELKNGKITQLTGR